MKKKNHFFTLSSCNASSMLKLCLCILSFSLLSYCATQNIFFFSISAKFTRLCRKWVAHIAKSTEKKETIDLTQMYILYKKPIFQLTIMTNTNDACFLFKLFNMLTDSQFSSTCMKHIIYLKYTCIHYYIVQHVERIFFSYLFYLKCLMCLNSSHYDVNKKDIK